MLYTQNKIDRKDVLSVFVCSKKMEGDMGKLLIFCIFSFILFSCAKAVPKFNPDRAFQYLTEQCDLGPRYPGSDGILLVRDYIINNLLTNGAEIEEQTFSVEIGTQDYTGVNIIASFYPRLSRRILLGAHYDTRPWADKDADENNHDQPIIGANDAASGVSVLLEIAAILAENQPPQYGVDMIFFDLEDMGEYGRNETWCLGSDYYAEKFSGRFPEKAIIVDMIGDRDLNIDMEYFSYHNSPELVKEIWDYAAELNFKEFRPRITHRIYDDHYPLIQAGFNAIVIIDFDYPYWHTMQDTPDKCSPNSLYVVGQTLLELLYQKL